MTIIETGILMPIEDLIKYLHIQAEQEHEELYNNDEVIKTLHNIDDRIITFSIIYNTNNYMYIYRYTMEWYWNGYSFSKEEIILNSAEVENIVSMFKYILY